MASSHMLVLLAAALLPVVLVRRRGGRSADPAADVAAAGPSAARGDGPGQSPDAGPDQRAPGRAGAGGRRGQDRPGTALDAGTESGAGPADHPEPAGLARHPGRAGPSDRRRGRRGPPLSARSSAPKSSSRSAARFCGSIRPGPMVCEMIPTVKPKDLVLPRTGGGSAGDAAVHPHAAPAATSRSGSSSRPTARKSACGRSRSG